MGSTPSVGEILAGRYRVERVLGEGGMGVVYQAMHIELEQRVALKLLHPGASPQVISRFVQEGRAAAKIKSDHIVRVHDVGKLDDSTPYMVMELLDGEDLGAVLQRTGRMPIDMAVDCALQAAEALSQAHALGIIHRDVKPSNLFLTTRRSGATCVKILDFGISKLGQTDVRQTSTQEVFGSPVYMSPEQLFSTRDVDARADVWSLAVVLYELLVAAPPFNGETLAGLHMSILQAPLADIRIRRPEVPAGLAAAIDAALVRDRNNRTPSVTAFAERLAPFASSVGLEAWAAMRGGVRPSEIRVSAVSLPEIAVAPHASTAHTFAGAGAPSGERRGKAPMFVAFVGGSAALLVAAGFATVALSTAHPRPASYVALSSAAPAEAPTPIPSIAPLPQASALAVATDGGGPGVLQSLPKAAPATSRGAGRREDVTPSPRVPVVPGRNVPRPRIALPDDR